MMFLHKLTDWLRKRPEVKTPKARSSARLRLEELEDRVVPASPSDTLISPSIQITPGFTVTEKVTVSVTPFGSYDAMTGVTTAPPTSTPPSAGTVNINLNNMHQTATLNGNGQATFTFSVPLLAFLTSQALEISYSGFTPISGQAYNSSSFLAPIYKNWDNVLLPSTISFTQPTPQQAYDNSTNPLGSFDTAQGEADTIATPIGPVAFNYVDPGTIDTITAFGRQFPGSLALQLGAYGGFPAQSSSK